MLIFWHRLLLASAIFSAISTESVLNADEPVCTSRYDYEYKVMKQLVNLDIHQDQSRDEIQSLKTALGKVTDALEQTSQTLRDLRSKFELLEEQGSSYHSGPTYIRWGRTTCPGNGSEIVYKGFAAGSHYESRGGASTYLCLPEDPTWNRYEDTVQYSGKVWGAEYEFLYRNQQNFFGKDLGQQDVPCCVCSTSRTSVVMIPGRNLCYSGWTLEYDGYLTSGHDAHHATEFVCLDGHPEALKGGSKTNSNGKLFYFTEAQCDPLKCPPYVTGRELTCAVCSK
ncbi:hypothetical protein ACF0H5_010991 [Mactra antiquata]